MDETDVSSNSTISVWLLFSWCWSALLSIFGNFVEHVAWLESVSVCVWVTQFVWVTLWPRPVRHDHAVWAIWCADAATVSDEELVALVEPSSVGIVAMSAWLGVPVSNVVAIWHDAGLLSISLLNELEQIWASSVNNALFQSWCISILLILSFSSWNVNASGVLSLVSLFLRFAWLHLGVGLLNLDGDICRLGWFLLFFTSHEFVPQSLVLDIVVWLVEFGDHLVVEHHELSKRGVFSLSSGSGDAG